MAENASLNHTCHCNGKEIMKTHDGNALLLPSPNLPGPGTRRRKRGDYGSSTKATKSQRKLDLDTNTHSHFSTEKEEKEEDEKAEEVVKNKIVALQRIVPGGEALGVDKLFEETAGYILALQCQIKAMRALTTFIEFEAALPFHKHDTKLGG